MFSYFSSITFQRYDKLGDLDDVVDWDNERDDDVDEEMNGKENIDESDDANNFCIEVSSDDEEQKEFSNVFHEVCRLFMLNQLPIERHGSKSGHKKY